jgi:hypothetical protein
VPERIAIALDDHRLRPDRFRQPPPYRPLSRRDGGDAARGRGRSLDALIAETVPGSIRQDRALDWAPMSEAELLAHMREIAAKNRPMVQMIGQGYYGTHTPPAIQRNVLENPAWYTAYTPYQPEIAQGGWRRC